MAVPTHTLLIAFSSDILNIKIFTSFIQLNSLKIREQIKLRGNLINDYKTELNKISTLIKKFLDVVLIVKTTKFKRIKYK